MRGHVTRRKNGSWAVVVDAGTRPVKRCLDPACHRKQFAVNDGQKMTTCPACGGGLVDGEDRRRKWYTFKTKSDATKALPKILSSLDDGTYVEPTRQDVATFLRDEWLPSIEATVKPTTLLSYRMHVEQHIAPYIGSVKLQKVSGSTLNALYAKLLKEGRVDGRGGLSAASVRRVHAMLHRAFHDAVRWNKLPRNPADASDPPKARADRVKEIGFWSPDESDAFLASVSEDRLAACWRLLLATGMRRGEVLGLRWSDIDLERQKLAVRRSLVAVGYEIQVSTPKSGKARVIDLDPKTVAMLRAHKARQAEEKLFLGAEYHDDGTVFAREDGSAIHPDRLSKVFATLVARSGLRRIRLHDLRHSHAVMLLEQNVQPKVVQERLGHHSASFTLDQYGHVMPSMQEKAAQAVATVLA